MGSIFTLRGMSIDFKCASGPSDSMGSKAVGLLVQIAFRNISHLQDPHPQPLIPGPQANFVGFLAYEAASGAGFS